MTLFKILGNANSRAATGSGSADGEEVREELQRDMKTPWGVTGVFTQLVTVL